MPDSSIDDHTKLAAEVMRRFALDQASRRPPRNAADQKLDRRVIDEDNLAFVKDVLGVGEWPPTSILGEEAAEAFFVLVQHADRRPSVQRQALDYLIERADRGEVPLTWVALLADRTLTHSGKPQRYGTQMTWSQSNGWKTLPVDDPTGLAERQAAMGLAPPRGPGSTSLE